MHSDERTLTDRHGVDVFYRTWTIDAARGVVLVSHGMSEHSGRYDRFAHALNDAGWAVYAPDHRGHGRTGEATGAGRVGLGGGVAMLDDMRAVVDVAAGEAPGAPVVVFGHSMGALLTQAYVERHGDGLAGYAVCACPGPWEGAEALASGLVGAVEAGMGDEVLDMLGGFNEPFEPARTPMDWLSRDAAEVDKYLADPFCGSDNPMTYGFVHELFELGLPAVEPAGIATVPSIPVLLLTGERDPVTGMGAYARELEKRLRDAGLDVTSRFYPEARHELLNETNRDEVTADILSWLAPLAR